MLTHQKPAQYRISVSQKKYCKYHRLLLSDRSTGSTRFILLRFYGTHHRIIFSSFTDHIFIFNFILMLAQIFYPMYFRLWLQNQFFRCTADGFPFRQNMQNQSPPIPAIRMESASFKAEKSPVRKPGLYIFLQPGRPGYVPVPGQAISLISIAMAPFIFFCLCTTVQSAHTHGLFRYPQGYRRL